MELYMQKLLGWDKLDMRPDAPYWKSMPEKEREDAPTHCGPNESYPVGPGCAHVKAAWTLALSGHGHPNVSCIKSYAQKHGCFIPASHKGLSEWKRGL